MSAIKLTDIDGRTVYVMTEKVVRVNEASVSSKWHGVQSIVRLSDNSVVECQENVYAVSKMIADEEDDDRYMRAVESVRRNVPTG